MYVCMYVCSFANFSETIGRIGFKFGGKMRLIPVSVLIYISKVKVTTRSKVKFTFSAISTWVFKLELKIKKTGR